MLDPSLITSPYDLTEGKALTYERECSLHLPLRTKLGFKFHWLRQVSAGVINGEFGINVDTDAQASMRLIHNSSVRKVVSLDSDHRLRLQFFKQAESASRFAAHIDVAVEGCTGLPDKPDALIAALLGVHETEWLEQLRELAEKGKDAAECARIGLSTKALKQFFDFWDELESEAAEEIWKVSGADPSVPEELKDTLAQLQNYSSQQMDLDKLQQGLESLEGFSQLDDWTKSRLAELFGPIASEADFNGMRERLHQIQDLGTAIYQKALGALEKKTAAEIDYACESAEAEAALLDCSFDFTPEGLSAYRKALEGDFSDVLTLASDHVRLRQGVLTQGLREQTFLALHLPFLSRREWSSRLEVLAGMKVDSSADGRLLVYTVEASHELSSSDTYQSVMSLAGSMTTEQKRSSSSFTLTYHYDEQMSAVRARAAFLPLLRSYSFDDRAEQWLAAAVGEDPDRAVEASLALTIPGSLVAAWLDAPGYRDSAFASVYARVSVAVQQAMRDWLSHVYFSDPARYETLGAAYPLLVYKASRPFPGKGRTAFTYDVMAQESVRAVCRTAALNLPDELARVEQTLLAGGRKGTAAFYTRRELSKILAGVQRRPRQIRALLAADAFFVDALIDLGTRANKLKTEMGSNPQEAVKSLAKFAAALVKTFHKRLRRLYAGQEFLAFGALLLVEATNALQTLQDSDTHIQGVFRVSTGEKGNDNFLQRSFVNSAYLP